MDGAKTMRFVTLHRDLREEFLRNAVPRKFRSNIAQGRGGERELSVFSFSGVKKLARWNDVASFDAPGIFSWELFKNLSM